MMIWFTHIQKKNRNVFACHSFLSHYILTYSLCLSAVDDVLAAKVKRRRRTNKEKRVDLEHNQNSQLLFI